MTNREVADLLHEIAVLTKDNAGMPVVVSDITGLAYRTVMNYYEGNIQVTTDFLRANFQAKPDPRLRPLLEPTGWRLFPDTAAECTSDTKPEPESAATDIVLIGAEIMKAVRDPELGPGAMAHKVNELVTRLDQEAGRVRWAVAQKMEPKKRPLHAVTEDQ